MKKKTIAVILAAFISAAAMSSCAVRPEGTVPETSCEETSAETSSSETSADETEETLETTPATEETEPEEDTTAPFFMNINREVYVTSGDEFNINDYISYIDDHDSDVDLSIGGSVDMSTPGTYSLSLSIEDDDGNACSDQMTVFVLEPVEPGTTESYSGGVVSSGSTSFGTFRASYPGDDVHYGIDVSKWQGNINWQEVANAGCEFAFIRAGWSSGGEFHQDEYFTANMEGASAAGVLIGVYVYTTDNSIEDVEALADTICDLVADYDVDLPIVFDWENFFSNFQRYNLSIDDINDLYLAFEDRVESRGLTSMLYASKFVLDVIWDDDIESVWLAHYTSQSDYQGLYLVWQQSCTGSIPGIDAYVDMDLYYGDLPGG